MDIFNRTYKQERGPAVPSFEAYAKRISAEFSELLATNPDERSVQTFLENNPSMVPGAETPGGSTGHWPFHLALITHPPLHGFNGRCPDFMWLSTHSGAWYPAMIEIERPGKLIYSNERIPRAEFNQARNQLVQWETWLNEPANQVLLTDHFGIEPWARRHRQMGRHFILVYGRRAEFEDDPMLSKERGNLLKGDHELMSFDRLSPNRYLSNAVTVKAIGNGKFKVIAVPETYGLSPAVAKYLEAYVGLEEAIDKNARIGVERGRFLKERIAYWRQWQKNRELGATGGDFLE